MRWKLEERSPDLLNGIQRPGSRSRVRGHAARLGEGCDVKPRRAVILRPYSVSLQGCKEHILDARSHSAKRPCPKTDADAENQWDSHGVAGPSKIARLGLSLPGQPQTPPRPKV